MSQKRQLEDALATIERAGSGNTFEPIRNYLQLVRELRVRDSEHVTLLGAQLLRRYRRQLREEEMWLIMEQVVMAALDVKELALALSYIKEIKGKFPKSQRCIRLSEMFYEASGQFDEAEALLQEQLQATPQAPMLLKRQVALEKSRDNLSAAIEALRKYVDMYQTDREAWEELGELYLQVQLYPQAATCYEELLLHQPASIATHVQLADVLYTMGGAAHYRAARAYYAAAVDLSSGENVRALYGLCATAAQLSALNQGSSKGKDAGGAEDLGVLAGQALLRRYARDAEDKVPLVKATLKAQGLLD